MPGLSGRLRPPASKSKAKISTVSIPSHGSPPTSRPSSRVHQRSKHAPDRLQLTSTSDKATTALIRRVLCPNASGHGGLDRGSPRPLEELLPPLTSMNEVDLQLYALIAVVMKEFVHSWYSKITPDTLFTEEVVQLIAHCTRALEQRLRRVDVETLLFDGIPSLLEAHIIGKPPYFVAFFFFFFFCFTPGIYICIRVYIGFRRSTGIVMNELVLMTNDGSVPNRP